MFRLHRPLISIPAVSASDLCGRRLSRSVRGVGVHPERLGAFGSLSSSCSGGSPDPFPPAFAPVSSNCHPACPEKRRERRNRRFPPCRKGFTFPLLSPTSCPCSLTEQNESKNRPLFSCVYKRQFPQTLSFLNLTNSRGDVFLLPQGLVPSFVFLWPRNTGHAFSGNAAHHSLFTTHESPHNFYPPAPDLRHNPAAQARTSVPLNQRAHSSSQTGRIQ
jgi:hypothetical protein